MFGYFCPGGGGHEHGGAGNIEGVRAVAAGADHVDEFVGLGHGHFGGKFAHYLGSGADFRHGFHFDAQADEDGGNQLGGYFAAHDLAHEVGHFIVEEFVVAEQALQGLLGGKHRVSL